jgi:hypothetical protein
MNIFEMAAEADKTVISIAVKMLEHIEARLAEATSVEERLELATKYAPTLKELQAIIRKASSEPRVRRTARPLYAEGLRRASEIELK